MAAWNFRLVSRDRSGSTAVYFGVALTMLLGIAALAVDGGYLFTMRDRAQMTADAAALAAASRLPNQANALAAAREYAQKNLPVAANGTVLADADIEFGSWNSAVRAFTPGGAPTNAVRTTIRRASANGNAVDTIFANAVGVNEMDVSARAVATRTEGTARDWDLLIVQDVTNSFGQEIADARVADQALLDCVRDSGHEDARLGVTIFTGTGASWAGVQDADDGYTNLSNRIGAIRTCGSAGMPACSGTHIGAGIDRARSTFSTLNVRAGADRAIVLVSDGAPNPSSRAPLAVTAANNAWAEGTHVFTVYYDRDNNASDRAFLASLVRGDGIALSTPNAAQLPDLLSEICNYAIAGPLVLVD